jgi:hypothetical protein
MGAAESLATTGTKAKNRIEVFMGWTEINLKKRQTIFSAGVRASVPLRFIECGLKCRGSFEPREGRRALRHDDGGQRGSSFDILPLSPQAWGPHCQYSCAVPILLLSRLC